VLRSSSTERQARDRQLPRTPRLTWHGPRPAAWPHVGGTRIWCPKPDFVRADIRRV